MITVLEGLLLKDSLELKYKLSLRVASLLEADDKSRKRVFTEIKSFYDLRSQIVHGSAFKLKSKQQDLFQQVPVLREYVRRVLLCVMALLVNGVKTADFDALFDEMIFDEDARKKIHEGSAKFIHFAISTNETVC